MGKKPFKKLVLGAKDGAWLNAERVRIAAFFALMAYGGLLLVVIFFPNDFKNDSGQYLILDFNSFWTAAKLALEGQPLVPYSGQGFLDLQKQWTGDEEATFAFFYPPTWLLYVLPLGHFSQITAYLIFNLIGAALIIAVGRAIFQDWKTAIMLCAFPAAMNCMLHGQNGFLSAALLGGAVMGLQHRRYVLAGILIGLLSYKPQMGLIIPLALIFAGQWRTFIAASITTLAVAGVSLLAFGLATWLAFFEQLPLATLVLQNGIVDWEKMTSIYAALRLLGLPHFYATLGQSLVALLVMLPLFKIWRRPSGNDANPKLDNQHMAARAGILIGGGLMFTPFALAYDLTILIVPIAFYVKAGMEEGFLPYEKTILALVVILSATTARLTILTGIPIAPLLPIAIIWLALQHHKKSTTAAGT